MGSLYLAGSWFPLGWFVLGGAGFSQFGYLSWLPSLGCLTFYRHLRHRQHLTFDFWLWLAVFGSLWLQFPSFGLIWLILAPVCAFLVTLAAIPALRPHLAHFGSSWRLFGSLWLQFPPFGLIWLILASVCSFWAPFGCNSRHSASFGLFWL